MTNAILYPNNDWKTSILNHKERTIPSSWIVANIHKKINEFKPSKFNASIGKKLGAYPFFNASEKQSFFSDNYSVDDEAIIITTGGDYAFSQYFNGKFSYSSHVWCFKMKDDDNRFFNYLFKYFFEDIQNLAVKGFKLKNLNKKDFKKIDFYFPPIEEQEKIVHLLSSQEKNINTLKKLIIQIDNRNKFMFDEILSGRIRVKKVQEKIILVHNSVDNWQQIELNGKNVDIPKDWSKAIISSQIIQKNKSKMTAKTGKKLGLYPFFNCSEKQTLRVDNFLLDEEVLFLSTGGKPSVLYSIGKSAYSTDVWAISFQNELKTKFVYYFLKNNNELLSDCFKGSGLKHLNKKDFLKTEIQLMPIEEQILIISLIDNLGLEKQKYEQILYEENKKFTFLLEELISGRLRVEI